LQARVKQLTVKQFAVLGLDRKARRRLRAVNWRSTLVVVLQSLQDVLSSHLGEVEEAWIADDLLEGGDH
jgi:hypothetical protein